MNTLWKKEWADTDSEILDFTIGDDRTLDNQLIPYDIIGSLAHAKGLRKIGILTDDEATALNGALQSIQKEWEAGQFRVGPKDEDAHSALERTLTAMLGDVGKKIHTGRSRNDQVLTALRMLMKAALLDAMKNLADLALSMCSLGRQYTNVLMPGYTHMQRAMPSTLAFWYASFSEGFTDTIEQGRTLFDRLDSSPLGAAAGYGVPLPLDRAYTARLMGFGRVHVNTQAVQNSRGRLEIAFINWLVDGGRDVEKMAWDLLLFSSGEFGFVKIPESLCTGSSIMPQKKNADVLELLRATPSVLIACRDEAERIVAKLPSAYHRDLQLTKTPLFRAIDRSHAMVVILKKAIEELTWDEEQMKSALSDEMFATHRALQLVKQGVPFRKAYLNAAKELEAGDSEKWQIKKTQIIQELNHLGAPGNPGLDEAKTRLETMVEWINKTQSETQKVWNRLLE